MRLQALFAVYVEFQGRHHVVVGERALVGLVHKGTAVTHAWDARQTQALVASQQTGSFRVHRVDDIHLPRHQRLGACGRVRDVAQLHLVKVSAVGLPVRARFTREAGSNAGLEHFQHLA